MHDLTFAYKDEAFTDSMILADGAGLDHRSVIRLIISHKDDLEEFGKVGFQIAPSPDSATGQKMKICRLNEQQATFLISLMKNTKPVVAFKKELVRQFFCMKEYIHELVTARHDYPLLTEQIKLVHENPKPYHFSNECDMLNRLVTGMSAKQFREAHGIEKGKSIRPYLTAEQIDLMEKLQKVDVGLLVAVPDFEQRKQFLEKYKQQIQRKQIAA